MFVKGCSFVTGIGCLVIALILGALAVWIFYPYLEEKGITPSNFRDEAIEISEKTAKTANSVAKIIKDNIPEKDDVKEATEERLDVE